MTGYSKKLEAGENAFESGEQWRNGCIGKSYTFEHARLASPAVRSDEEKL